MNNSGTFDLKQDVQAVPLINLLLAVAHLNVLGLE